MLWKAELDKPGDISCALKPLMEPYNVPHSLTRSKLIF